MKKCSLWDVGGAASANTASENQMERSLLIFTPIDLLTRSLGHVQIPAEAKTSRGQRLEVGKEEWGAGVGWGHTVC